MTRPARLWSDAGRPDPILLADTSEGVALLTLNDPCRRNILSGELAAALINTVAELESQAVKALVITGHGRAFCAGADLGDLLAASDGDLAGIRLVYDAFGAVADFSGLTVAAVNGPAVGAGLNLALVCDVRVAGRSARFDSRFLSLGIHPGGGHIWMLERLVGPQTAAMMVLLGEQLDAEGAVRHGLAWSHTEDDELVQTALTLARRATASAHLLRDAKTSLVETPNLPARGDALGVETERQLASLRRDEASDMIESMRRALSNRR